MPLYKCLNNDCAAYHKVVEKNIRERNANLCAECGKLMASAEEPADPRLGDAEGKVKSAMGKLYANSYQEAVIEDLKNRPYFFQGDFIDEMGRDSELDKFVGKSKRPTDADKVCVDNALKAVGYAFPANLPIGEKFTFELPYIMDLAGWDFLHGRADIFVSNFTALANRVAATTMYLVCAKQALENAIGHMIVLTTDDKKNAYLTDAQKQPNSYGVYRYVAWRYGNAPVNRPKPCREIDLKTGKFSGTWVEK